MRQALLLLPAWMVAVYVGVFLHELGHALAGRRNGYEIGGFGFGVGRPRLVVRIAGFPFYIGRQRLGVGLTLGMYPTFFAPAERHIRMLSGGIVANLITLAVALLFALLFPAARPLLLLFATANLLLVISSSIPKKFLSLGLQSDGGQIRGLRRGYHPLPLPGATLQSAKPILDLLEGLKFHSYGFVAQMAIGIAHAELGQFEQAEAAFSRAKALPLEPDPARAAYTRIIDAGYLSEIGQFEEALVALDEAYTQFREQENERGAYVARLNRALVLLKCERVDEATPIITELEQDPLTRAIHFATPYLTTYRLRAAILLKDDTEIDRWLTAYQAVRKHSLSEGHDSQIYTLLAICFGESGRPEAIGIADRALSAFEAVYRSCPDVESRAAYLAKEQPRLKSLATMYAKLGQADRLADIDAHFAAINRRREQALEEKAKKQKQAVRRSLGAYVAAIVITIPALWMGLSALFLQHESTFSREEDTYRGMGVMVLFMGAITLVLTLLLLLTPRGRTLVGWYALALSLIPWLFWLFLLWMIH